MSKRRFTMDEICKALHKTVREGEGNVPLWVLVDLQTNLNASPSGDEFERQVWMLMEANDPDGTTGFFPSCEIVTGNPILTKDASPFILGYKKEPYTVTYRKGHG